MKMNFAGRHMKVFDVVKEMAEKKLSKFERFFHDDAEMDVTFSMPKNTEKVEITIYTDGTTFRAEESSDTFANAIDKAIDSLERQIRKNKTRLEKTVRKGAFVLDEEDDDEYTEEGEFEIRIKTFPFKPMSPEEAVLQMNLLGHSFYAFTNAETGSVAVVYKRKEGSYGLIVQE
jgi:putative sigma-54 modulation protein